MTYHRAKGLEFDAVFLPRLLDGELPYRARKSEADPDEERRLLYVGITRAREHLFLSWPREPRSAPSPFLREIGVVKAEAATRSAAKARSTRTPVTVGTDGGPLFDRLKEWRRRRASTDGVPAYVVFHDSTLAEIAERRPSDWADLAEVPGIGPAKLDRYADEVLAIVSAD
jgi:DNA helicase-2/ATP-dependent DNA helicase PcrA